MEGIIPITHIRLIYDDSSDEGKHTQIVTQCISLCVTWQRILIDMQHQYQLMIDYMMVNTYVILKFLFSAHHWEIFSLNEIFIMFHMQMH